MLGCCACLENKSGLKSGESSILSVSALEKNMKKIKTVKKKKNKLACKMRKEMARAIEKSSDIDHLLDKLVRIAQRY